MTAAPREGTHRSLTLEQIGARAGVSRSTVSRVLNEHPDVRPAVRARVEAVIRETGYEPNHAARALASNRSGVIALVMFTEVDELFGDPYYSALVTGIQQGCDDHGLLFAVYPMRVTERDPDTVTQRIAQGFVDGVIVTAGPRSDRLIPALRDRARRMVVVGHPADEAGLLRVDVENQAGSVAAVTHLCDHGHARVGFVGATPEHAFGVERLQGYREALTAPDARSMNAWFGKTSPATLADTGRQRRCSRSAPTPSTYRPIRWPPVPTARCATMACGSRMTSHSSASTGSLGVRS